MKHRPGCFRRTRRVNNVLAATHAILPTKRVPNESNESLDSRAHDIALGTASDRTDSVLLIMNPISERMDRSIYLPSSAKSSLSAENTIKDRILYYDSPPRPTPDAVMLSRWQDAKPLENTKTLEPCAGPRAVTDTDISGRHISLVNLIFARRHPWEDSPNRSVLPCF